MSDFKLWLMRMWHEHCLELESYRQPINYDSKEYFQKYKYWLKREYQYQRKIRNVA